MKRARAKTIPQCNRDRPEATEFPEEAVEEIIGHTLLRHRDPGNRFMIQSTSHSVNALRGRDFRSLNAKFAECEAL